MRKKTIGFLATISSSALLAALLTSPITPASANSASVFIGPDFPSEQCRSLFEGSAYGVVPQQWNSVVGLPVATSGNPAAQRIVIPEFDQIPSMPAVNALLRQCGLLAANEPDFNLVQANLPAGTWGLALQTIGGEATLDGSIAYAALPPNTDVVIANTPSAAGWYGFFVNAAQACGIEFATPPEPTNTAASVPQMSKGNSYPAGGCIITASWGISEQDTFTGDSAANSLAAAEVLRRLAELGVLVFISAGDEGAGGCLAGSNQQNISTIAVSSGAQQTISGINFFPATITVTTSSNHSYSPGNLIVLYGLSSGVPGIAELSDTYLVLTDPAPTATTFAVKAALGQSLTAATGPATGSVFRVFDSSSATADPPFLAADFIIQIGQLMPQFPATHPDVVAVGGTQWLPQAETLQTNPFSIPYTPGRPFSHFVWRDSNQNSNCVNAPSPNTLGQEGTGGGQSNEFPMPTYQRAAAQASYGDLGSSPNRMMPDIAALAGWPTYAIPNPTPPGNQFCTANDNPTDFPCAASTFPWSPVVGTSAAAPLTAIGFANVNAALTARGLAPITKGGSNDIHSIIYSPANSSAIRDVPQFQGGVSSGNNNLFGNLGTGPMGYEARDGFDMATGMGVPNFTALANLLIARNTPAPPGPGPAPAPEPAPAPQPAPAPAPQPAPAPDPVTNIISNPSAVTGGAVSSLTPAQVAAIPVATFRQLPPRAFRGLTPDQVRAMSTDQVAVIRPARARAIRPAVLRSFTPAQVRVLRPKSVRALRPEQVRLLRPVQLRALRPAQRTEIRPAQRRVMTPAQLRALRR